MTDLILAPNLTTLNVSPALWRLLSTGPVENIEMIGTNPALRDEAASLRESLQEVGAKCGPVYVQRALATLVLVYGLGEQASAPEFWKFYNDVLSGLPRIALDRAIKEWGHEGKFFPKPADLKERAQPHAEAIWKASSRVGPAANYQPPEDKRANRTPEDIEAVQKMLSEFKAVVVEKNIPEPKRKPVNGPIDGNGVTAAGRELIERMRQMQQEQR